MGVYGYGEDIVYIIHVHVRDIHVHVDSLTKGEDDDKNETDEPDHMFQEPEWTIKTQQLHFRGVCMCESVIKLLHVCCQ